MSDDWFAASLIEAKAFLDEVGVHPVTVEPGDPILASLVGLLDAAVVIQQLSAGVTHAANCLRALDPPV